VCVTLAALLVPPLLVITHADHEEIEIIPADVRQAALEAGLDSLARVKPPVPDNLDDFLKSGSSAKKAAIQLGKALYWDMQVGSDGQACASCHYHAGTDNRTKNQLSPGLKNEDPGVRDRFDPTASGGGGPNYELTAEDFPFRQLEDPFDRTSPALHDSDDVCSSQGVFRADFVRVVPGESAEVGGPAADATFNVGGVNVRRVEPRNTPSVINAVYNFVNFWDGSAHHIFNGVSSGGPFDADARILVKESDKPVPTAIRINNSSLASQAVAPPRSDIEMAFLDRPFRDLGRKLLTLRPLDRQLVHPKDSVLGKLSRAKVSGGRVSGKTGLSVTYADLIERAFERRFWDSDEDIDGYTQMEHNFSLFFGLALQMYESTLVSDRTPFDAFMEGNDQALTSHQLGGLLVFINRGPGLSDDPVFEGSAEGNCVSCHRGAEFTAAGYSSLGAAGTGAPAPIGTQQASEVKWDLVPSNKTAFFDIGFSNIGVRPTAEDLGRGGMAWGRPLSFVRQHMLGVPGAPELPACGGAGRVDVRVAASADDAEENSARRVDLGSSDLELTEEASAQTVGIRFAGVDIPPGASIDRAYIQFSTNEVQRGSTSLLIQGEATNNAPGFTTATGNVSSRARTSAAVPWPAIPAWTMVGESGPDQRTPDIAAVIQEIVSHGSWTRGNALAVILTGSGRRTAESFDGEKAQAPLLHVEYTLAPGATGGSPACPEGNRAAVDGAFKVPGLRNVDLTGPYFHNGGQATLKQVVVFYERLGDFSNENVRDVDANLARIFFTEPEEEALIEFMLTLTDERVREEREPFDHPQLFVPNGHLGDHAVLDCASGIQACDDLLEIPPVGKKGRGDAGLSPLGTFLGLDPFDS
jgi:cytochrome c peroxidase